jgi:hypothetical protein
LQGRSGHLAHLGSTVGIFVPSSVSPAILSYKPWSVNQSGYMTAPFFVTYL